MKLPDGVDLDRRRRSVGYDVRKSEELGARSEILLQYWQSALYPRFASSLAHCTWTLSRAGPTIELAA